MKKLSITFSLLLSFIVSNSFAYPYFIPYHEIQRQQAITNQINQQSLWGDYPGGRNSSLDSYSQSYTNINNSSSSLNNNQQYQEQNTPYNTY